MKRKSPPTSPSEPVVRWLTTERACNYLGVSRDFLEDLRDHSRLSLYKVGRTVFYDINEIDNLIIKNKIT